MLIWLRFAGLRTSAGVGFWRWVAVRVVCLSGWRPTLLGCSRSTRMRSQWRRRGVRSRPNLSDGSATAFASAQELEIEREAFDLVVFSWSL